MEVDPLVVAGELTSEARLRAASALRDLGHILVAHQPDDATFDAIAEWATAMKEQLATTPPRREALIEARVAHLASRAKNPLATTDRPNGSLFADSFVSGRANPMGINAVMSVDGDHSVAHVTIESAFEGAPGRSHGGVVAAIIDETMGGVLGIIHELAFTGWLKVTYRNPTPMHVPLECRAWLEHRNGRKLALRSEVRDGEQLIAEAEALFIVVDPSGWHKAAE